MAKKRKVPSLETLQSELALLKDELVHLGGFPSMLNRRRAAYVQEQIHKFYPPSLPSISQRLRAFRGKQST